MMAKSTNGGASFGAPTLVAHLQTTGADSDALGLGFDS